jgi:hypothetical protein
MLIPWTNGEQAAAVGPRSSLLTGIDSRTPSSTYGGEGKKAATPGR